MDILGKSIIQNYLDMHVVLIYCIARVQKHGTYIHRGDVDERAVFVSAQNNSNKMLAKTEMEI
jgi:hypothetical protein